MRCDGPRKLFLAEMFPFGLKEILKLGKEKVHPTQESKGIERET